MFIIRKKTILDLLLLVFMVVTIVLQGTSKTLAQTNQSTDNAEKFLAFEKALHHLPTLKTIPQAVELAKNVLKEDVDLPTRMMEVGLTLALNLRQPAPWYAHSIKDLSPDKLTNLATRRELLTRVITFAAILKLVQRNEIGKWPKSEGITDVGIESLYAFSNEFWGTRILEKTEGAYLKRIWKEKPRINDAEQGGRFKHIRICLNDNKSQVIISTNQKYKSFRTDTISYEEIFPPCSKGIHGEAHSVYLHELPNFVVITRVALAIQLLGDNPLYRRFGEAIIGILFADKLDEGETGLSGFQGGAVTFLSRALKPKDGISVSKYIEWYKVMRLLQKHAKSLFFMRRFNEAEKSYRQVQSLAKAYDVSPLSSLIGQANSLWATDSQKKAQSLYCNIVKHLDFRRDLQVLHMLDIMMDFYGHDVLLGEGDACDIAKKKEFKIPCEAFSVACMAWEADMSYVLFIQGAKRIDAHEVAMNILEHRIDLLLKKRDLKNLRPFLSVYLAHLQQLFTYISWKADPLGAYVHQSPTQGGANYDFVPTTIPQNESLSTNKLPPYASMSHEEDKTETLSFYNLSSEAQKLLDKASNVESWVKYGLDINDPSPFLKIFAVEAFFYQVRHYLSFHLVYLAGYMIVKTSLKKK